MCVCVYFVVFVAVQSIIASRKSSDGIRSEKRNHLWRAAEARRRHGGLWLWCDREKGEQKEKEKKKSKQATTTTTKTENRRYRMSSGQQAFVGL